MKKSTQRPVAEQLRPEGPRLKQKRLFLKKGCPGMGSENGNFLKVFCLFQLFFFLLCHSVYANFRLY
jgi:hypothetical protein